MTRFRAGRTFSTANLREREAGLLVGGHLSQLQVAGAPAEQTAQRGLRTVSMWVWRALHNELFLLHWIVVVQDGVGLFARLNDRVDPHRARVVDVLNLNLLHVARLFNHQLGFVVGHLISQFLVLVGDGCNC